MNKSDLADAMAEISGLTRKDCEAVLNAFTQVVEQALRAGDKVKLAGFGSFEAKPRAAHVGRNPRTGEVVEVPAGKAAVFKAGKPLKAAIQGE